jgi:hypothetical protein
MYPNGEAIGAVFNGDDVMMAQLALARAQVNFEVHDKAKPAECEDLRLPAPNKEGVIVLDQKTTERVISVAKVACAAANQNLWFANNLFIKRRHDRAEPEELQCISIEIASEKENVQQFEELSKNAEACLLESQDIFIDKNLAKQQS